MPTAAVLPPGTTAGGFLLVFAILLPVAGVLFSVLLGGRYAERAALVVMPLESSRLSLQPSSRVAPTAR